MRKQTWSIKLRPANSLSARILEWMGVANFKLGEYLCVETRSSWLPQEDMKERIRDMRDRAYALFIEAKGKSVIELTTTYIG